MWQWLGAIALIATGCATPYQEMGLAGGVSAQQMTSNTFRIEVRGNAYTGTTSVQDYAMLKAAETTRLTGGTHFVVISAEDASRAEQVVIPGSAQTNVYASGTYATANTTYTPAQAFNFVKPGQNVYIRTLALKPGQSPPAGAISADEIIQYVGSRVKRG